MSTELWWAEASMAETIVFLKQDITVYRHG